MARLSLDERLNRIEDKISEKSFRENKGLGNEVGYYIFDYDPREELYVRNHIAYLKDRINNGNKDFSADNHTNKTDQHWDRHTFYDFKW